MRSFFNVLDTQNKSKILTAQNARADIIGELDAIMQYQSHYDATDDVAAKKTISSIMSEEKVHVGELFGLLFSLDPESKTQFEKGLKEFEEINK